MTGDEQEAQQVIANVVVESGIQIRHGHLFGAKLAAKLLMLAIEKLGPAEMVHRTMFGGGHEPGARVVRDARLRPSLERGDESILREILGKTDIAHDPREAG